MEEKAQALHARSFVLDAHCDTVLRLAAGESLLPDEGEQKGHVDIPRLREGGVNAQVFALWVDHDRHPLNAPQRTLTLLDAMWQELERHDDVFHPVLEASDFDKARAGGKIGVLLSIEDGAALGGSLAALRMFYRLGVRALGLTWNGRNELAEGIGSRESGGGLTRFGRDVVREMERLGMVVDVSHLTERGFWDVVDVTTRPFIASHSNAHRVCEHPRNLTDEQIRALADKGGVMGMNFCAPFVRADGAPTLDDMVAHIDHISDLVGPQHVGIGSDYDGIRTTPTGLEDVSTLPRLTEALLSKGYEEGVIEGILGRNFKELFEGILS